ncbi:MAG: YdeI/OmpD-associated family protein [Micromonosporaceae bacterium]
MERFEGVLEAAGGGGCVVELPAAMVTALGGKARVRVRGHLNGVEFRSNTAVYGGRRLLGVHKAVRLASGVDFGDTVTVELEIDDTPREVVVPPELASALASEPELDAAYQRMSFSHRNEYATWVAEAKRPETRQRRAAQALEKLRER